MGRGRDPIARCDARGAGEVRELVRRPAPRGSDHSRGGGNCAEEFERPGVRESVVIRTARPIDKDAVSILLGKQAIRFCLLAATRPTRLNWLFRL